VDAGELGKIQYVYSNRLNLGMFRTEENILWSFAPTTSRLSSTCSGAAKRDQGAGGNYLHPTAPT